MSPGRLPTVWFGIALVNPLTSEEWVVRSRLGEQPILSGIILTMPNINGMEALTAQIFCNPYGYMPEQSIHQRQANRGQTLRDCRYEHENSVVMPDRRNRVFLRYTGGVLFKFIADTAEDQALVRYMPNLLRMQAVQSLPQLFCGAMGGTAMPTMPPLKPAADMMALTPMTILKGNQLHDGCRCCRLGQWRCHLPHHRQWRQRGHRR